MKQISEFTHQAKSSVGSYKEPESVAAWDEEKTAMVVNELFAELCGMSPAYKQALADPEVLKYAKRNWMLGLQEAGIRDSAQIKLGLKRCRHKKHAFMPSVGQFIEWCKPTPEDLGLPSPEDAYKIALLMNREFDGYRPSSEAIALVVRDAIAAIGSERFRHMTESEARSAFFNAYPMSADLYAQGRLQNVDRRLKDDSAETREKIKKESVVKEEYKNIDAKRSLAEMRKALGLPRAYDY